MRIAIVTDSDLDKISGVTTALRAVLKHRPADISPRVYTLADVGIDTPEYRAFRSAGVPIPFRGETQIYLPKLRRLRECLSDDRVDVVHFTSPGPAGLGARYLAGRTALPLIGSFHTQFAERAAVLSGSPKLGALVGAYLRWLYGACRQVLVPSNDTRLQLIAAGWNPDRLAIWPCGVDSSLFSPERRSRALRVRWGVCDRRPAVLYVGGVSREKCLERLPSIEALLFRRHIACRLIVAGDGPLLPQLKARLPDAVFMGTLSHEEVAVVIASSDVFLSPSETDTGGNVVLEAQASALPVIVTGRGGPRENMIPGETGHVCWPGDALDLSLRLGQLLIDRAERIRLSEAARAYAVSRSWRASLEPLFAAYRAVASTALAERAAGVAANASAAAR